MSGPDSISDPVACRINYTRSYPSARGSAPTQLGSQLMTLHVGPTLLSCQLTGCWQGMPTVHADVIPSMPTVHDDITNTSCWRHQYPGQSHGSGQLVFGLSLPIRAKKTRGARLRAWIATSSARVGACGMSNVRFWRRFHQWLRLFLLYTVVWSKT
jgi:hypothetical protein